MFTKMVLPILGGAPSVWSVAMVFFQAALLVGYGYAHLLARTLPRRTGRARASRCARRRGADAADRHAPDFGTPPEDGVALWLVGLFAASIGLPFAALSASAPLLQSWFAASGHPQARNPYVLYAASNLGSFAALLAYPLAIESLLPLRAQAWVWSVGFAGLAVLVAIAGMIAARGPGPLVRTHDDRRQADAARSSGLDHACGDPGRTGHCGHRLYLDRRRRRAAAVGAAARALPADFRGGVPRPAVVLA